MVNPSAEIYRHRRHTHTQGLNDDDNKKKTASNVDKKMSLKRLCYSFWISFVAIAILAWFEIVGPTFVSIGEQEVRPPEPVILPIPPSGDENNPYFVNVTSSRQSFRAAIHSTIASRKTLYNMHHRGYYLVTTNYPWSVVMPNTNGSDASTVGGPSTPLLQKTSHQAANRHCDIVAVNGGPFDKGGRWNSGPVVSKGRLIRTKPFPEESQLFGFGISLEETLSSRNIHQNSGTNRNWVMGQYGQLVHSSSALTLWDFVTGFGWLVYDGKPRVTLPHSSNQKIRHDPTGVIRAPRTAVGVDKNSNLMLLVVDGCERCLSRKGLTLEELADLLVHLGALYAINMDGGGSSTMVMPSAFFTPRTAKSHGSATGGNEHQNYSVVSRPTCLDLPFPLCQRAVSTVLCVSTNRTKPEVSLNTFSNSTE